MLFASKQKKIESLLADYRQKVSLCLEILDASFAHYLNDPDREQLGVNFAKIHKTESAADDIRREIEVLMYTRALFPESRGDIMGLLEAMDRVPNQAEASVRMLLNQRITIPPSYRAQMTELINICRRCVETMLEGAEKLFSDFTTATVTVGKVDELESQADHIEEAIVNQVFSSDMNGFDKILLRDLVKHIAGVSDRAENVADRIRIIVAKRGN